MNVDLTTEEIQELIDDNIDDFLNNTTVTVNQENHNSNTTNSQTIVNHNNYSTIESPSSLKSKSGFMTGIQSSNNFMADGVSLLVRGDRYAAADAGNSAAGLNGANICVGIGTDLESDMQQWFSERSIDFTSVPTADYAEGTQKFRDGECDALAFSSAVDAEQKKDQLDNDETWSDAPSEGIWTTTMYEGEVGELSEVWNSISILIDQPNYEAIIGLRYVFLQTELSGTCDANASGCENFTIAISPERISSVSTCSHGTSFHFGPHGLMDADKGVYSYWGDNPWGDMFGGTGFNCTHSLNFEINLMVDDLNSNLWQAGFDRDSHALSWGEWVYSIVWETRAIYQEN